MHSFLVIIFTIWLPHTSSQKLTDPNHVNLFGRSSRRSGGCKREEGCQQICPAVFSSPYSLPSFYSSRFRVEVVCQKFYETKLLPANCLLIITFFDFNPSFFLFFPLPFCIVFKYVFKSSLSLCGVVWEVEKRKGEKSWLNANRRKKQANLSKSTTRYVCWVCIPFCLRKFGYFSLYKEGELFESLSWEILGPRLERDQRTEMRRNFPLGREFIGIVY